MNKHTTMGCVPGWRGLMLAMAMGIGSTAITGCVFGGSEVKTEDGQVTAIEPDDEGMYAYQRSDGLLRLDGNVEWEAETWDKRNDLAPDAVFVIRDAALAELSGPVQDSIGMRKVAWVRSEISEGGIAPAGGARWRDVAIPGLDVPLGYVQGSETDPEVVQVRPLEPLEPGLYSFYMNAGEASRESRIGIGWPGLDQGAYAADVCVDQYVGQNTGYRMCEAQVQTGARDGMRIYLVEPKTRTVGSVRSIVVSGVIVNNTGAVQNVPLLAGEFVNAAGEVLTRWHFQASSSRLEPGQSASFHNEFQGFPERTHSVNVNFDTTQASNQE